MSYGRGRRSAGKRIRMDESPPSSDPLSETNYRDQSEDAEFDPMAFYQQQQQEMLLQASQHIHIKRRKQLFTQPNSESALNTRNDSSGMCITVVCASTATPCGPREHWQTSHRRPTHALLVLDNEKPRERPTQPRARPMPKVETLS